MTDLVTVDELKTERVEQEDTTPKVGEWYWVMDKSKDAEVKSEDDDTDDDAYEVATSGYDRKHKYDEPGGRWLACVVHVGSNFAEVEGVYLSCRIGLETFHLRCTRELDSQSYVRKRIGVAQESVRGLLGEIQHVTALLGVAPRERLADEAPEGTSALVVAHETADVKGHKKALVLAKEKTLPALFKQVEEQHGMMAMWMKADLIPAKAELKHMETSIERIDDRIQTVELYAGLEETLKCVRRGEPGDNDAKVNIMQRMAFMDEECLANYEAGGMRFDGIGDFDKWLARDDNFRRLLPHERTVIAFRVRRNASKYDGPNDIASFIKFIMEKDNDKWTFLYIRNGNQLWRMHTSIDFEEELFPDQESSGLLGDNELWVYSGTKKYITSHERDGMIEKYKLESAELEEKKRKYKEAKKAWLAVEETFTKERKLYEGKAGTYHSRDYSSIKDEERREAFKKHNLAEPREPWDRLEDDWKRYEKLSPDHLYYDDAMKHVARVAFEHNRVAVIIQGLLDRSTCLQPHPPWRIWTQEGFTAGIVLVYDATRVISSGDVVDFEAYRTQLNKSLKVGSVTYGQQDAWKKWKAEDYSRKHGWQHNDREWYFSPSENPGPGRVAEITKLTSKGASFAWTKKSERARWVPADRPGYRRRDYDFEVPTSWTCPVEKLFNVTAYTPGDFHMFFDDPRTRAEYMQWAPFLLSAEDFHAGKLKLNKRTKRDEESEDA